MRSYNLRRNPKPKSQSIVAWNDGDFMELEKYHPELLTEERFSVTARVTEAQVLEHCTDQEMNVRLQWCIQNGMNFTNAFQLVSYVAMKAPATGNKHLNALGDHQVKSIEYSGSALGR